MGPEPAFSMLPCMPAGCCLARRPDAVLHAGGSRSVRPLDAALLAGGLLGPGADRDRDLARGALRGLGDGHLEHTVLELSGDRLGIDALGQPQRTAECARAALEPVIAAGTLLVLGAALAGDGQE